MHKGQEVACPELVYAARVDGMTVQEKLTDVETITRMPWFLNNKHTRAIGGA